MKTIFKKIVNGCELRLIQGRNFFFVVIFDLVGFNLTQICLSTRADAVSRFVKMDILNRQLVG
jgi:hypothetical protein